MYSEIVIYSELVPLTHSYMVYTGSKIPSSDQNNTNLKACLILWPLFMNQNY